MNYLAHLHLAKISGTSYCGNLLGDFAKHIDVPTLPQELVDGMKMHQFVDKSVDSHLVSIAFREEQTVGRRRFVGIAQDILMDYWLVRKWHDFESISLETFYDQFLPDLIAHQAVCPPRLQSLIDSLDQHRWLADLGELYGVENAFKSIMRRWQHGHYLQPFYDALPLLLEESEPVFDQIYPDLITAVKRFS